MCSDWANDRLCVLCGVCCDGEYDLLRDLSGVNCDEDDMFCDLCGVYCDDELYDMFRDLCGVNCVDEL